MAHLLVVDDEPGVLALTLRVLAKAGHRVTCAESLETAVAVASADPIDLLLCDKNLPGATGFEVIDRLRELDPELPAIMMTAYPEPLMTAKTRIQGYLPKPMENIHAITDAVNRVLAFTRRGREAKASAGDEARSAH